MAIARFAAQITDYPSAAEFLGRDVARKLAHNTTVKRRDGNRIAIRYYETDIVTYTRGGFVTVDLSWTTRTTLGRINKLLPYGVYVCLRDGQAHIGRRGTDVLTPATKGGFAVDRRGHVYQPVEEVSA